MGRTVIRESQVLSSDFASEVEMEARFELHNTNKLHPPAANEADSYLHFDGTDYVWSEIKVTDFMPKATDTNQIIKSTDDLEWIVVRADDPEEGLKVISLPYYWDEDRQKYLDNQSMRVMFYMDSNARNEYLYYVPDVRSSIIPYLILENEKYCITGFMFISEDENDGDILEIRNVTGRSSGGWYSSVYTDTIYTVNLPERTNKLSKNDLNIDVTTGTELCLYALGTTIENPAIILILRRVWEPT